MSRTQLRRRIVALQSLISPVNSLQARMATLTADQMAIYKIWRDQSDRWQQQHPGPCAYASLLEGEEGPQLCRGVSEALFAPATVLTTDMPLSQVAEIYRRMLEN
jgi:hypothetical protein